MLCFCLKFQVHSFSGVDDWKKEIYKSFNHVDAHSWRIPHKAFLTRLNRPVTVTGNNSDRPPGISLSGLLCWEKEQVTKPLINQKYDITISTFVWSLPNYIHTSSGSLDGFGTIAHYTEFATFCLSQSCVNIFKTNVRIPQFFKMIASSICMTSSWPDPVRFLKDYFKCCFEGGIPGLWKRNSKFSSIWK